MTAGDRAIDHFDGVSVRSLDDGADRLASVHGVEQFDAVALRLGAEGSVGTPRDDDFAQSAAGSHSARESPYISRYRSLQTRRRSARSNMTTPCVMLLSAVASNWLLASRRRSVNAPT